jgi:DNA-directed RNA polymerase specialized sigma24 family protein
MKESTIPRSRTRTPRQRQITADKFAALLRALGDTSHERGIQYETLRSKLIFFFARRSLQFPEDLADEVLDRLAHRIAEGVDVVSPPAFALGIARYVAQEQSAKPQSQIMEEAFWNNVPALSTTQSEEEEITRMERCLKKLPHSEATMLRSYYLTAADQPMHNRQNLAKDLGISANALRQRVFLARQSLRACMTAAERKKKV